MMEVLRSHYVELHLTFFPWFGISRVKQEQSEPEKLLSNYSRSSGNARSFWLNQRAPSVSSNYTGETPPSV